MLSVSGKSVTVFVTHVAVFVNPHLLVEHLLAHTDGKNVIFEAQEYLKILGMCEEMFNQKLWVNEDGHICDEEGNRLSADREHRVFEVIKCGK